MIDACVVPEKKFNGGVGAEAGIILFSGVGSRHIFGNVNSINLNFPWGSGSPRSHSSRSTHEMNALQIHFIIKSQYF